MKVLELVHGDEVVRVEFTDDEWSDVERRAKQRNLTIEKHILDLLMTRAWDVMFFSN